MRTLRAGLIVALVLAVVGCSDIAAPVSRPAPRAAVHDVIPPEPDGSCRSGYSQASGDHGEIICVSEG